MRYTLCILLCPIFISACGSLESYMNNGNSQSSSSTDTQGPATTNSSEYAGTYVLDHMEVLGNRGTVVMNVLSGRCAITLGPSDASGWRTMKNNSYCRIGVANYSSLIDEKAVTKLQLNSLGAVIRVDESQTQTTSTAPKDIKFIDSSMVFGLSSLTFKVTTESAGERLYQTMIYYRE